ncbi:MAG: 3'-5' exonuclease, partial [Minisyncoccia bacterium]
KIIEKLNKDFDKFYHETLRSTAGQLIYKFLKETTYLKDLVNKANNDPMAGAKIQNIAKFFEKIREFEHVSSDKSLLNFKNHLDILIEAGEDPATADIDPDLDVVNILTIHKAKGLEFKVVFLVNLYQGSFPVRKQSEVLSLPDDLIKETLPSGDYHLQEERRLFYVGVTRACEELYLTTAYDYGGKKRAKISQFVLEFFDKPELKSPIIKTERLEIIKKNASYEEKYYLKNFYNGQNYLKLNPHQIDDYLSCPLKFKYVHILKIPILEHHPVIYGSAIHKAIEEYYTRRLNNYPVKLSEIIKTFESNWKSIGFITREHEEKRFVAGQKALKEFFKRENKNKNLPSFIEKKFNFLLNYKSYPLKIKISGRYDALYLKNKPRYVEIRDFKTGEVKEQKKADLRAKENR